MSAKKHSGHYCKVCGAYKSNESFSGKGHNAHICKKCASLSLTERNKNIALNKIYNMVGKYLSKDEKVWLENKMRDKDAEVKEAAAEIYNQKFPYAEMNKKKKQLLLKEFSLHLKSKLYTGDEYAFIECKFYVAGDKIIKENKDDKTVITLPKPEIRKILRILIHNYEVFTWSENNTVIDESNIDIQFAWKIDCVYSNAERQVAVDDDADDNVESLYFELNSYFE